MKKNYPTWKWLTNLTVRSLPFIIILGILFNWPGFALHTSSKVNLLTLISKEYEVQKTRFISSTGFAPTIESKRLKTVQRLNVAGACLPVSSLDCEQIAVPLPYLLNFDGSEGGLSDKNGLKTGFTMADAYSGTRLTEDGSASSGVIGYEPTKLTISNGRLNVLTSKGIAFTTNNNQVNSLGVGVAANGKITLETTLVNPYNGSKSEQAGLWFGLHDKTFVRLSVIGNRVELRRELNDITSTNTTLANPDQRVTDVISGLNTQTVRLRMVVDVIAGTLEGFYSTDGVTYLNAGARYTSASYSAAINIANLNLAGKSAYAGIYATHRNATSPVNYSFDKFSVSAEVPSNKVLSFVPNALDFKAVQGGKVTSKYTVLTSKEGTPTIKLSNTSASWLTLPAGNLGTITFGSSNFSTTMAPGIYETTVTATADGYEPATLLINLTITEPGFTQEVKVNFQDPTTTPPTGWEKDFGQPFGLKESANNPDGFEYGWKKRSDGTILDLSAGGTIPGNGRNRKTPSDVVLATLMHMQADDISGSFNGTKVEGYWEMKVPNGTYDVSVTAGDAEVNTVPESHNLNVEGKSAISGFAPAGSAGSATRFKTATVRVSVTDGLLTINADGGTNTKINSAVIKPVAVNPYLLWSASNHNMVIEKGSTDLNTTFSLELSNSADQEGFAIGLQATYGSGAANWLSFDASHNSSEPNVTFNYGAAKSLPEGTYEATVTASAPGYTSANTLFKVTVLAPGSNQPYVVSSSPANGATHVSVNISSIAANNLYVPEVEGFKGGVDNSTITTSTVKVLKISGTTTSEVKGIVQGTGGGDAISFSPSFALEPNTKYKFVVTSQVKSYSGAAFLPYEATFTTGGTPTEPSGPSGVQFAPKQVIPGTEGKKYTSVTFGPDGRFYALRLDGVIERFEVNRETGMLSSQFEITSVVNKHGARSAVGLTFDPASTATNLIAWVSHCSAGLSNAPEFDGNLSKLTGSDLGVETLVLAKLPRSQKDHLVNNIVFGPDGALYFNQGSNSSMGAYDGTWKREESLLAGAVLKLDLTKLKGLPLPLDVRTTNDQKIINNAPSNTFRMSDGTYNPYATNSPLTIYASGVRNAYDLVWHTNGQLYVPTNGSAAGGNSPASVSGTRRPDGTFYNGPAVPATYGVKVQNDWLFRVNPLKPIGYFGHPNPLRGEYAAHRGYIDNPKYPSSQGPDANYRGAAFDFELNKSPNGVIEYKSDAFGGALKGRILVCRFSGGSDIIVLEPGSMVKDPSVNSATSNDKIYDIVRAQTGSGTNGISGLGGFTNPLDLTEDVQTGNLYVIEYNWNNISDKTAQIVLVKAASSTTQAGIAAVSPAKIVDNDVSGGEAGKNHTITIANTGNSNLTVTNIALDGTDKAHFQLVGAPAPTASAPLTIARGSAVTFNVAFNPTSTGVKVASLVVTSNNNPIQKVSLRGLGTAGLSGANEASLQSILDVHDIMVNVGDDDKTTNTIHSTKGKAALLGEEVSIQAFQRVNDGPVTLEPLSVFAPQHSSGTVVALGWYPSGNTTDKNELFTVSNSYYQTVDVEATGSLAFDPGFASFGFYTRYPYFNNRMVYGEDALNTFTGAIPHHVRVYPLKNPDGTLVENAYVLGFEETTSGFDYQDLALIVRNVKPYVPVVTKELNFSAKSLAFTYNPGTTTPSQTSTLTSSTGTPAITLTRSENSSWLVLPQATLGSLSFNINEAGLTPGTYQATVTASAEGYSSAILTVNLTVNGGSTNQAPVLASIGNKTVVVNQQLNFIASATDSNTDQAKTFSLAGAPQGATINATTGAFTWTPATTGSYTFVVKVTDNGSPALSDEEQITVNVTNAPANAIRINAGGTDFTTANGRTFIADKYYGGTDRIEGVTTGDILNTTDDAIYQSGRSATSFNYTIPVSNGSVNVVLHFAETYFGAPGKVAGGPGKRMFNVDIEGSRVLTNYDIYAKAGGAMRPVQETFQVNVEDGFVNINFTAGTANIPKVSGIEVLFTATAENKAPVLAAIGNQATQVNQELKFMATATDEDANQAKTFSLVNAPQGATINATTGAFTWTPATAGSYTLVVKVTDNGSPALSDEEQISVNVTNAPANAIRINAGGTDFTTADGRTFIADKYYGGTDRTAGIASGDILNTVDDIMYRSGRSATSFNYAIPATNGTVNVVLHFAETYFGAPGKVAGGPGKRMFNVDIEGSRVLTNYDIYAKAGGAMRAIQETFQVNVMDGFVNINFTAGTANMPYISAIEVVPTTASQTSIPSLSIPGAGTDIGKQESSHAALAIYPNPNAGDRVEIKLQNFGTKEQVEILLQDVQGRVIQTKAVITNEDGKASTVLTMNHPLNRGIYIILSRSKTVKVNQKLVIY